MRRRPGARGGLLGLVVLLLAALLGAIPAHAAAPSGQITAFAGTIGEGLGTGVAQRPRSLAARGSKVYVGSESMYVIRELDTTTGRQRVIAGNGRDERTPATAGDSGSALAASLGYIEALTVDAAGNVYAVDSATFRVRKITPDGTISIVAGNGTEGFSGDGGPARSASLGYMHGLAVDAAGNLFIADTNNNRLRRVDRSGVITTIAGNGTVDATAGIGDGGAAIAAPVRPLSVAVNAGGRVYIGDGVGGGRVRTILPDGTIATVAGGGGGFPSTAGIAATSARLYPGDLKFAPDGTLLIADVYFVSRVDLTTGQIVRAAGTGSPQFRDFDTGGRSVDGRLATDTNMNAPQTIAVTADGDLYIGDVFENRVWRVDGKGILTTVGGTGYPQLAGDGGPAAGAMFSEPADMVVDPSGAVIVADQYNQRIRRIDAAGGITTIAGSGSIYGGFGGDGGPATSAQLSYPSGVALDAAGNLYIADQGNFRIRRVDRAGTITTFALVPHEAQKYSLLGGIAVERTGNVYLSQVWPRRVLKFDLSGRPTTLIGSDEYDSPSSSPRYPQGLALGPDGALYVADMYGGQVLRVDTTSGAAMPVGTWALDRPSDVAFDAGGNLYITDGPRVLRVQNGRLTTVAGTGVLGSSGNGGPATSARLSAAAVTVAGSDLLVVDRFGAPVIRRVSGIDQLAPPDAVRGIGWNGYGMLGDTTLVSRSAPATAPGLRDATSVAAGFYHSLAAKRDGTVWATGWNVLGMLGNGTNRDSATYVPVTGLSGVTAVAAGVYHSLALKSDGTVWAWGWNGFGQLGDGTKTDRYTPARVPGLDGVVAIASGAYHSVALKSDGSVWTWGWNAFGQLGIGTTVDQLRPVRVPGLAAVRSVAAGSYHTLVATQAGTVATWGWNGAGQLGDGTKTDRSTPVTVGAQAGIRTARAVAGGLLHSAAIGQNGETWTWGSNAVGQLGDGTLNDHLVPIQLQGLYTARTVAAGALHTLVVRADQTVVAWGWNASGQLGDGTTVDRWRPTVLPGVQGVLAVSGGLAHSLLG